MRKELEAKLDDEDELAEAHHDEDPALRPHPLALGVRDVGVVLPGGGRRDQPEQEDPEHADGLLHQHQVPDEESVELHHLPDQHELNDRDEPHVGGEGVQQVLVTPALGGELQQPACT